MHIFRSTEAQKSNYLINSSFSAKKSSKMSDLENIRETPSRKNDVFPFAQCAATLAGENSETFLVPFLCNKKSEESALRNWTQH